MINRAITEGWTVFKKHWPTYLMALAAVIGTSFKAGLWYYETFEDPKRIVEVKNEQSDMFKTLLDDKSRYLLVNADLRTKLDESGLIVRKTTGDLERCTRSLTQYNATIDQLNQYKVAYDQLLNQRNKEQEGPYFEDNIELAVGTEIKRFNNSLIIKLDSVRRDDHYNPPYYYATFLSNILGSEGRREITEDKNFYFNYNGYLYSVIVKDISTNKKTATLAIIRTNNVDKPATASN